MKWESRSNSIEAAWKWRVVVVEEVVGVCRFVGAAGTYECGLMIRAWGEAGFGKSEDTEESGTRCWAALHWGGQGRVVIVSMLRFHSVVKIRPVGGRNGGVGVRWIRGCCGHCLGGMGLWLMDMMHYISGGWHSLIMMSEGRLQQGALLRGRTTEGGENGTVVGVKYSAWMGWNADIEGRGLGELCTYVNTLLLKVTDIQEKDKNKAKNDKTEHENRKSVKQ
ncbi:hypothetical protein Tco_1294760 [Tanacetum coccineum]